MIVDQEGGAYILHSLVAVLQQEYGCRVYDVRERRRVLLIDTDRGELAVKAYDDPDKARWMVTLCQRLRERGFQQTLEFLPSRRGHLFFFHNGQAYTVSKKIEGRSASYRSVDDLNAAFTCLARFHQAARHIAGGPPLLAGKMPQVDKWSQRTKRFATIVENLNAKKERTKTELLILRLAPAVLREAKQVTDWLARSSYERQVNRARVERRVAHRDLANHNFLIGRDEEAWLIDYDTAAYDSQLVDVIQMLGRSMVQQRWNFDLFANLLDTYGRIVSLNQEEVFFVYVMLKYPDDIMREVNGYYERQPGFHEDGVHYIVRRTDRDWGQRQAFFDGVEHFFTTG